MNSMCCCYFPCHSPSNGCPTMTVLTANLLMVHWGVHRLYHNLCFGWMMLLHRWMRLVELSFSLCGPAIEILVNKVFVLDLAANAPEIEVRELDYPWTRTFNVYHIQTHTYLQRCSLYWHCHRTEYHFTQCTAIVCCMCIHISKAIANIDIVSGCAFRLIGCLPIIGKFVPCCLLVGRNTNFLYGIWIEE